MEDNEVEVEEKETGSRSQQHQSKDLERVTDYAEDKEINTQQAQKVRISLVCFS
jgi:hypothetical protein